MIVKRTNPPNFASIARVFPHVYRGQVIFAYGDTVYNPSGVNLTRELLAHEAVHGEQQAAFEGGVEAWWKRYLSDRQFVFEQELPAHVAEYKAYRGGRSGFSRAGFLLHVAGKLAGGLYNNVVTKEEAVRRILEAADA